MECLVEVLGLFKLVCELLQLFSNSSVEVNVSAGDAVGRTKHTELKFITCKCEWGSSVTVSGILAELRQNINAKLHFFFLCTAVWLVSFNSVKNCCELLAQEDRQDGRWCFVGSQAVGVGGTHDGCPQQVLVLIDHHQHVYQEGKE